MNKSPIMLGTFAVAMAQASCGFAGSDAQVVADANTAKIINAVMKDAYGDHFDAKLNCWAYTEKDDSGDVAYCMQPGTSEVIDSPDGKQLYLSAHNVLNTDGSDTYMYAHVQFGMMGVFQIKLNGQGGWSYISSDKDLEFGAAGACGCEHAALTKLSDTGDYGWVFSSGGMWQGIIVSRHNIIARVGEGYKDISAIPEISEDDQDTKYLMKVDPAAARGKEHFYPIKVTATSVKTGKVLSSVVVHYDAQKQTYALPNAK